MPDLNETRSVLETAFINGWGATTPIKFENVVFDDRGISAFVSVKMINYISDNVCIGSIVQKRIRHIGALHIKVYTKQNIGAGSAYDYADQVRGIMDNVQVGNLFTKASTSRVVGETEDGWFVTIVEIPYISDEE